MDNGFATYRRGYETHTTDKNHQRKKGDNGVERNIILKWILKKHDDKKLTH
jgi:hypothetical protein